MENERKIIYRFKYQERYVIEISSVSELLIDGTVHDKDTSLPIAIPLISKTTLKGKIRKATETDIDVKVTLRHLGIGTNISVYANNVQLDSQTVFDWQ